MGTALYGGDAKDIARGALYGGAVAWSGYQIQKGVAYQNYKKTGGPFTYKQYNKVSVASQRSFARGKEFGGWILDDDIQMWTERADGNSIQPSPRPSNTIGEFHTHPNWGGNWVEMHCPPDQRYAIDPSYVIGRQNVWFYNPNNSGPPTIQYSSMNFNV